MARYSTALELRLSPGLIPIPAHPRERDRREAGKQGGREGNDYTMDQNQQEQARTNTGHKARRYVKGRNRHRDKDRNGDRDGDRDETCSKLDLCGSQLSTLVPAHVPRRLRHTLPTARNRNRDRDRDR
jgi:hypothetical protein